MQKIGKDERSEKLGRMDKYKSTYLQIQTNVLPISVELLLAIYLYYEFFFSQNPTVQNYVHMCVSTNILIHPPTHK